MKILHISNGYADSKVHSNLTRELDKLNQEQTVYCPVRSMDDIGKFQFDGRRIKFVYSYCIKYWYRFVYHYKAARLYADLKSKIDVGGFDVIHAPTAFSDGALAYKVYKEFHIPYVVAVRSTDISDFIERKMYHTWPLGKEILYNAKRVYFVSVAGMNRFKKTKFGKSIWSDIESKCEVRPNGIDDVWINNINFKRCCSNKICYVGTFLPRKNIKRVVEAVSLLREQKGYKDLTFRIIGGGSDKGNEIQMLIDNHPEFIEYMGRIVDKNQLMSAMRECSLFVMPSIHETFGLVYVEALTQGLPVIYSKNDGIDGYFDKSVGIAVEPHSTTEIANAIKSIIENYNQFGNQNVDFDVFEWEKIAEKYMYDYRKIMK